MRDQPKGAGVSSWDTDPNALSKALIMVLTGTAIYLGLWLIVGVLRGSDFELPESEVWRAIVCCQGVLWSAALWQSREDLKWAFGQEQGALSYFFAVLLALTLASVGPRVFADLVAGFPNYDLLGDGLRQFAFYFSLLGGVVGALLATTIGVTLVKLRTTEPTYALLSEARTRLRRTATSLSVILVVAVASTSWLSKAMETAQPGSFPAEAVISYGLYFTAVLLIVYLPVSTEFYRAAIWLANKTHGSAEFDKDKSEARGVLLSELGITAGDAFQGALATLGPIASAVLGVALGSE